MSFQHFPIMVSRIINGCGMRPRTPRGTRGDGTRDRRRHRSTVAGHVRPGKQEAPARLGHGDAQKLLADVARRRRSPRRDAQPYGQEPPLEEPRGHQRVPYRGSLRADDARHHVRAGPRRSTPRTKLGGDARGGAALDGALSS